METIFEIKNEETRKCSCCGKELPITEFMFSNGSTKKYHKMCSHCRQQNSGTSEKFKDFTSRELIEELRNRGYRGELTFIQKVII